MYKKNDKIVKKTKLNTVQYFVNNEIFISANLNFLFYNYNRCILI